MSLTESVIAAVALGSSDLGIGGKPDRYVNQTLDSKSSRKSSGQDSDSISGSAAPCVGLSSFDDSWEASGSFVDAPELAIEGCKSSVGTFWLPQAGV